MSFAELLEYRRVIHTPLCEVSEPVAVAYYGALAEFTRRGGAYGLYGHVGDGGGRVGGGINVFDESGVFRGLRCMVCESCGGGPQGSGGGGVALLGSSMSGEGKSDLAGGHVAGDGYRGEHVVVEAVVEQEESPVRGVHYKRNKARKAAAKAKANSTARADVSEVGKLEKSVPEAVPEWRRKDKVNEHVGSKVSSGNVERKGFFSECDDDVQKDLRTSRARMLIAENNRKALTAERATDVNSPEYFAREILRVMGLQKKVNAVKDTKVGKWAGAVVESVVQTVASSAPSSVPSLEEVGFGAEASESSAGVSDRVAKYKAEVLLANDHFDTVDMYYPEDRLEAMVSIREEFADVIYEPVVAERVKDRKVVRKFLMEHMGSTVGVERMFDVLDVEYADVVSTLKSVG